MSSAKICPKCGTDYGLTAEYCTLMHCPFCGGVSYKKGKSKILIFWGPLIFIYIVIVIDMLNKLVNGFNVPLEELFVFLFFNVSFVVGYYEVNPKTYRCSRCGKRFNSPVTNVPLVKPSIRCPRCGAEMPATARFCGHCGAEI